MKRTLLLTVAGVAVLLAGTLGLGRPEARKTIVMDEVEILGDVNFDPLSKPVVAVDAGAREFSANERREDFRTRMSNLAKRLSTEYSDNVTVQKIYFATNNSEKADAAIVVMHAEKLSQSTALVFIYNDGWKTFPSDFQ